MPIDLNAVAKANLEGRLTENDIDALIGELRHFQNAASYLASCHAATLEGLPKSASAHLRNRLVTICQLGADFLELADAPQRPTKINDAVTRCRRAASESAPKAGK